MKLFTPKRLSIAMITALFGGGLILWSQLKTTSGNADNLLDSNHYSEQILFDQMDFYDHPTYLSNFYPPFSPERVRKKNSFYYFRYKGGNINEVNHRYGELITKGDKGSLLYLPPAVKMTDALGMTFRFRKQNSSSQVFFSWYDNKGRIATVNEGELASFPKVSDTDWHQVVIPLSQLKFDKSLDFSEKNTDKSETNLANYQVDSDDIMGLEIGLVKARNHESLFFDKIAIIRPAQEEKGIIRGKTEPAVAGLPILINTPQQHYQTLTDAQGNFNFKLPASTKRFEVLTQYKQVFYLPTAGRYFEVGTYIPEVIFKLNNNFPTISKEAKTNIEYETNKLLGGRYIPNRYYLVTNSADPHPEYFTETSSNNYGYLDRDRRFKNLDGVRRIVYIGDCIVAAQDINGQERFSSQAEAIFRFKQDKPTEVIPVGHTSLIGLSIWPALKNYAFKLKPEYIFIDITHPVIFSAVYVNTVAQHIPFDPKHPWGYFFDIDSKTGELTHLPHDTDWAAYAIGAKKFISPENWTHTQQVDWSKDILRVDRDQMPLPLKHSINVFTKALTMFVTEAKKQNIKIVVAYSSIFNISDDKVWEENGVKYSTEAYKALVKNIAENAGAEYVDVINPILAQVKGKDSIVTDQTRFGEKAGEYVAFWRYAYHWPPIVHRLLGEEIVKYTDPSINKKVLVSHEKRNEKNG